MEAVCHIACACCVIRVLVCVQLIFFCSNNLPQLHGAWPL